jgi:prepilin signal peptidase PulO-like enzyme (type II secretory pathway)
VGGGTVWAVRLIAGYAMGQEAMGFGDVTLMAMIGAFLGWQAALAAFFLAPLAALLIVVIQYIATREPAVPFGPYLCFGAVLAVVGWDKVWNQSLSMYVELGVVLVAVLLGALFAMGAMLFVWGQIKKAIFAE